jgi:hypothetical protein
MSTPSDRKESHIRIQKSKNGRFVMLVLVYWDKEGVKHQQYFSVAFYNLHAYVNSLTKAYFLFAEQMISKDDPKYKAYIQKREGLKEQRHRDTIEKHKKRAKSTDDISKQNLKEEEETPSANDPITLKLPLKT